MTVHLDISQLVQDPRRSGIQRAERELIRHWPNPAQLRPCMFDHASAEMHELPAEILQVLCQDAPPGGVPEELERLQPLLRPGRRAHPSRLLNAELFVDPARAAYYRRYQKSARPFWLVYDFLPWLHPEWFSIGSAARLMPYLSALRQIPDLAFISERTQADYNTRIMRHGAAAGPVIAMGGDGLALERQHFSPDRNSFVMIGTIEPRKNAAPAMQAFKLLWNAGVSANLVMVGAVSPDAPNEIALMEALHGNPRFRHLRHLSDAGIRDTLRTARALLFPSEGEGYGIPPMEALHASIPVIISAMLPAFAGKSGAGQIRLKEISAKTIAAAVKSTLDDSMCQRLWSEAAGLEIPSWSDFARNVSAWVHA